MKRAFLLSSVIGLLLLGLGSWAYGEAFPNRHVPVGWMAFCILSAAIGVIQALTGGVMLTIPKHASLGTQILRSGLFWLLIGGGVCAVPFLLA